MTAQAAEPAQHPHAQPAGLSPRPWSRTEGQQLTVDVPGQGPGQLHRIALATAEETGHPERRRNHVHHTHALQSHHRTRHKRRSRPDSYRTRPQVADPQFRRQRRTRRRRHGTVEVVIVGTVVLVAAPTTPATTDPRRTTPEAVTRPPGAAPVGYLLAVAKSHRVSTATARSTALAPALTGPGAVDVWSS
jgi:hypothetical protein